MSDFKVGDYVKWKSQANGSYTTKTGVVLEIVYPGQVPMEVCTKYVYYTRLFDDIYPVKSIRYIVLVKNTERQHGKIYMPLTSLLEPA